MRRHHTRIFSYVGLAAGCVLVILLATCSKRPLKADFQPQLDKAVALADFYDKLAYVQERYDKTGRIQDPVNRTIINMVLQNGSNTVNNIIDMLTVYQSAATFQKDTHTAVRTHIRNRLMFLRENVIINLQLLEESKEFVFDAEVRKHVNDMIKYFQEIRQVIEAAQQAEEALP